MDGLSPYHAEEWNRKLSDFFKSIPRNPCVAEVVLFDIAGDRFGVKLWFVRHVVVIHIIRAKSVERHMRSPSVVPEFKFVAQFSQMVNAFDDGNPFEPFVFQGFVNSFGDRNGSVFADGSQTRLMLYVPNNSAKTSPINTLP